MLQVKDLALKAGNKDILNNVNLEINEGEVHVFLGPNGAGKSTLCASILNHPNIEKINGKILFNEKDITNLKTDEIAR